ncbi:MAG: monofunctional biosynthetic peptidoglycan transglycosylase [Acidobacteria bacterium]|nr:monofunctional biosynthetic peptidoglycan transglycosylase [Acidobacteriota bacterium]
MSRSRVRKVLWRVAWVVLAVAVCFYAFLALSLVAMRWITPPFTAVQIQQQLAARSFSRRYTPVPMSRIARDLQHAVVAAEDSRFFQHHGFDLVEIEKAVEEEDERGHLRGASTITQQLVKNLFFTNYRSAIRKGLEISVTPLAELILPKQRILELYLNVIEWGPGVYGAEAAAHYHYSVSAARVTRDQAARLAAVIPSPRRRRPARMDRYSAIILNRMRQMGW